LLQKGGPLGNRHAVRVVEITFMDNRWVGAVRLLSMRH
jgi:hypothetical protein